MWRKTTPEDRKRWLYAAMSSVCEPRGFRLLAAQHQFRRPTRCGFQTVIVSLSPDPSSTLFEVHLGVRHDDVESLAFGHTGGLPLFRNDSMTLVASTAKLQDKSSERFEVVAQQDADAAVKTVVEFLEGEGWDWLDAHQQLEDIHRALNPRPLRRTRLLPNQIHRCFRGLAVAQLLDDPDYDELAAAYDDFLVQIHAPEYQRKRFRDFECRLRGLGKPQLLS